MPIFPRTGPVTFGIPRKRRPVIDREQLETVEEHRAAQNAIEFATMRRQADDIFNVASRAAEEAPDEEGAQAIFDKATQAASKLQSKNIRVQNVYQAHLEGSLAGRQDRFARQAKAAQEKRTLDRGKQEYDAALDAGDVVGAIKVTEHMATVAPEDRAIFEKMAADAPSASALRQVRGAVAENDLQGARGFVEQARKLPLTVKQKEDLARLEGVVGRAEHEAVVQTRVELLVEADRARGLPEAERYAAIEEIKARYAQLPGISPADLQARFNWLNAIAEGEPFEADPNALYAVNEAMSRLNTDSSPAEREEVRDLILTLAPQIGEAEAVKYLDELGKRLEPAKAYAVKTAVDDLVARRVIDPSYAEVIRRELERFVNAQTGPFDPASVYSFAAGLAVTLPEEARKLPPVELSNILGQLKRGSRRLGLMGEVDPIDTRAKAVEVILDIWYDPRLTDENRAQLQAMLDAEYPRVAGEEGLQELPPPEWTPAVKRVVGQVYVNSRGQKAEWTGEGWKPVP